MSERTAFTADQLARLREQLQVRPSEAAALLAISERLLYDLTRAGEIASIGRGRLRRYAVDDLRAWQRRHRNGGDDA